MIPRAHCEALYNFARESGRQCHVLVDPLAGDDWRQCLTTIPKEDLSIAHLQHEFFAKGASEAPTILRFPLKHIEILETLADMARAEATDPTHQTRAVCGFLRTELSFDQLASQLQKNLTVRVESQRMYFRYFDPRVIHHLPELLDPNTFGMCGISAWAYFAWEGEWMVHSFAEDIKDRHPWMSLRLTDEQWRPFAAIEHFNATVSAFVRAGIPWPTSETTRLRQTVMATMSLGIAEPHDVATYLLKSRQSGFPLAQHPRWNDALALIRDGASLAESLDGLSICPLPT